LRITFVSILSWRTRFWWRLVRGRWRH